MTEKLRGLRENEPGTRESTGIFDVYKSLVCKQCNRSFVKKTALQAHVKSHEFDDHTYESKKKPLDKYRPHMCNICEKKFTAKKNLLKHLRIIHKNPSEAEKLKVKKTRCPELNCLFACRKMRDLRLHIEKQHGIRILKDTLQFTSETDFLKWKKEEEENSVASFVAFRRKGLLRNGTTKKVLLCHRTGQYSPKGSGKHRLKSRGSCKIGGTCPAAMEMIQGPDQQITVYYYKTHLGHSQDVIHLQLSREDRARLSERIQQGFSLDAILEEVKESIESGTGKTKRIHLLSRKDLYNIMQSSNTKKIKRDMVSEIDNLLLEGEANMKLRNDDKQGIHEIPDENSMGDKNSHVIVRNDVNRTTDNIADEILQDFNANGVLFENERVTQIAASNETLDKTTPQLVIVSPNTSYRSVAEVILLQPSEKASHHLTKPGHVVSMTPPKILPKGRDVTPKGKANKTISKKTTPTGQSPLTTKLKEKIEKLGQILPRAEFLTPKQYEVISGKLDNIINILNSVNIRAKSKRLNFKKTYGKKDANEAQGEQSENIDNEHLHANPQNVIQQQIYDTPLYAYVYTLSSTSTMFRLTPRMTRGDGRFVQKEDLYS